MSFVELLARSNFSFLRGASQPEEVVLRAAQLRLGGIALCDRDGLYGAARAYQQFKELRDKPERELHTRLIVGAELSVNPRLPRTLLAKELDKRPSASHPKPAKKKLKQRAGPATRLETSSKQEAKARASPHELPTVYCLVENHQGYSNLCQLLTLSHQDMPKGEGASEVDWLLEHAAGLRLVIPVPEHPALLFPLLSASGLG